MKSVRWEITDVYYAEHVKRGADDDAPRTMRVTYVSGVQTVCQEWVCVEHEGFAKNKANDWWAQRCKLPMPTTAAEAAELGNIGAIAAPVAIHTIKVPGEKFTNIVKYELAPIPDPEQMEMVEDEWGTQYLRQPGEDDEEYIEEYDEYEIEDLPF